MVIPHTLRGEMLERAHEGHLGIVKTKTRVREVIWWPGMNNKVEQLVSSCETCARFQNQQRKEPLLSTDLPQRPWEKVEADLFELEGDHYILLGLHYSKKSREAAIVRQVGSAASRSSLLLVPLVSTGI